MTSRATVISSKTLLRGVLYAFFACLIMCRNIWC